MSPRNALPALLGLGFLIPSALFAEAPPAEEVLSQLHSASRLGTSMLAEPAAGADPQARTGYVGSIASTTLGMLMGWGQDRFDNVDPEVVATFTQHFGAAFRKLEAFPPGGFDDETLAEAQAALRGHFEAIRSLTGSPARARRQLHELAGFGTSLAGDFGGSPLYPSTRMEADVAGAVLRALGAGSEEEFARLPELGEELAEVRAGLEDLTTAPPECMVGPEPTEACLRGFGEAAAAFTGAIMDATMPPQP